MACAAASSCTGSPCRRQHRPAYARTLEAGGGRAGANCWAGRFPGRRPYGGRGGPGWPRRPGGPPCSPVGGTSAGTSSASGSPTGNWPPSWYAGPPCWTFRRCCAPAPAVTGRVADGPDRQRILHSTALDPAHCASGHDCRMSTRRRCGPARPQELTTSRHAAGSSRTAGGGLRRRPARRRVQRVSRTGFRRVRPRPVRPPALLALLLVVASPGLAGCQDAPEPPVRIRIATGSPTAVYHAFGQSLAAVLNRELPDVRASVVVTAASAENVRLVGSGEAELVFTQADVLPAAPAAHPPWSRSPGSTTTCCTWSPPPAARPHPGRPARPAGVRGRARLRHRDTAVRLLEVARLGGDRVRQEHARP